MYRRVMKGGRRRKSVRLITHKYGCTSCRNLVKRLKQEFDNRVTVACPQLSVQKKKMSQSPFKADIAKRESGLRGRTLTKVDVRNEYVCPVTKMNFRCSCNQTPLSQNEERNDQFSSEPEGGGQPNHANELVKLQNNNCISVQERYSIPRMHQIPCQ